jgi:hypothetical protein
VYGRLATEPLACEFGDFPLCKAKLDQLAAKAPHTGAGFCTAVDSQVRSVAHF